ncbi:MAG: 16S rRNA (guanine(527)-N(7))-methyltransferase RsmG [Sphingomicrobium sp.]
MTSLENVSRETLDRLELFQSLLIEANTKQNLVSTSTIENLWQRHIVDSAQLMALIPRGSVADIGSGAGLPGIVLACLSAASVCLIEPRKLRADFLRSTIARLDLANAGVECASVEHVIGKFDVITARAVAPLDRLLRMAVHLSHPGTVWVLPKGKKVKSELAEARLSWHCTVREVPSETDPAATILILTQVKAKRRQ